MNNFSPLVLAFALVAPTRLRSSLASLLAFLHRVITLKEDPRKAWDMQVNVWIPGEGPWRKLMERQLKRNNIAFEPL